VSFLSRILRPSPSDCARTLGEIAAAKRARAALAEHEKILARTRQLRAEQGLPPLEILETGR
jgi:uncharacterized protein YkwD